MKKQISQFLFDKFELPVELLTDAPTVQLIGNYVMNIDGCVGIKKYETTEINLRCKNFYISVFGKDLTMLTFTQGRICIRGLILKYEIERL